MALRLLKRRVLQALSRKSILRQARISKETVLEMRHETTLISRLPKRPRECFKPHFLPVAVYGVSFGTSSSSRLGSAFRCTALHCCNILLFKPTHLRASPAHTKSRKRKEVAARQQQFWLCPRVSILTQRGQRAKVGAVEDLTTYPNLLLWPKQLCSFTRGLGLPSQLWIRTQTWPCLAVEIAPEVKDSA